MARISIQQAGWIMRLKAWRSFVLGSRMGMSIPFRILQNWLVQGAAMLHWPEFMFRILLEAILLALAVLTLRLSMTSGTALLLGFVLVHTAMWTLNGHFWALHVDERRRMVRNQPDRILRYLLALKIRVNRTRSVRACIVFGSLTRGRFTENSDLDIVFSCRAGLRNHLFGYFAGVRERTTAFFMRIPVELYFYPESVFQACEAEELPLLLKDDEGCWRQRTPSAVEFDRYPFHHSPLFARVAAKPQEMATTRPSGTA
jgi:predicted nucleotidyltransferase